MSTVASKGTKVKLTGTVKGEFSQVTWNGQTLWAATRYLSQSAGSPRPGPAHHHEESDDKRWHRALYILY